MDAMSGLCPAPPPSNIAVPVSSSTLEQNGGFEFDSVQLLGPSETDSWTHITHSEQEQLRLQFHSSSPTTTTTELYHHERTPLQLQIQQQILELQHHQQELQLQLEQEQLYLQQQQQHQQQQGQSQQSNHHDVDRDHHHHYSLNAQLEEFSNISRNISESNMCPITSISSNGMNSNSEGCADFGVFFGEHYLMSDEPGFDGDQVERIASIITNGTEIFPVPDCSSESRQSYYNNSNNNHNSTNKILNNGGGLMDLDDETSDDDLDSDDTDCATTDDSNDDDMNFKSDSGIGGIQQQRDNGKGGGGGEGREEIQNKTGIYLEDITEEDESSSYDGEKNNRKRKRRKRRKGDDDIQSCNRRRKKITPELCKDEKHDGTSNSCSTSATTTTSNVANGSTCNLPPSSSSSTSAMLLTYFCPKCYKKFTDVSVLSTHVDSCPVKQLDSKIRIGNGTGKNQISSTTTELGIHSEKKRRRRRKGGGGEGDSVNDVDGGGRVIKKRKHVSQFNRNELANIEVPGSSTLITSTSSHRRLREFKCPIPHCSHQYAGRQTLQRHLAYDHGLSEKEIAEFPIPKYRRRRSNRLYECSICNKFFPRKYSRERHMKVHTRELTFFRCSACDITFPTLGDSQVHETIHRIAGTVRQ